MPGKANRGWWLFLLVAVHKSHPQGTGLGKRWFRCGRQRGSLWQLFFPFCGSGMLLIISPEKHLAYLYIQSWIQFLRDAEMSEDFQALQELFALWAMPLAHKCPCQDLSSGSSSCLRWAFSFIHRTGMETVDSLRTSVFTHHQLPLSTQMGFLFRPKQQLRGVGLTVTCDFQQLLRGKKHWA